MWKLLFCLLFQVGAQTCSSGQVLNSKKVCVTEEAFVFTLAGTRKVHQCEDFSITYTEVTGFYGFVPVEFKWAISID